MLHRHAEFKHLIAVAVCILTYDKDLVNDFSRAAYSIRLTHLNRGTVIDVKDMIYIHNYAINGLLGSECSSTITDRIMVFLACPDNYISEERISVLMVIELIAVWPSLLLSYHL